MKSRLSCLPALKTWTNPLCRSSLPYRPIKQSEGGKRRKHKLRKFDRWLFVQCQLFSSSTYHRQLLHSKESLWIWVYIFGIQKFFAFSIYGHNIVSSNREAVRTVIRWEWQLESRRELWGSEMKKRTTLKTLQRRKIFYRSVNVNGIRFAEWEKSPDFYLDNDRKMTSRGLSCEKHRVKRSWKIFVFIKNWFDYSMRLFPQEQEALKSFRKFNFTSLS